MDKYLFRTMAIVLSLFVSVSAYAFSAKPPVKVGKTADVVPQELVDVGIEEKRGEKIDLSLTFFNEQGSEIPLSNYFASKKPVLLSLVYYGCTTLCSVYLQGITKNLKKVDLTIGQDYEMVVVSIDPNEDHQLASEVKAGYVEIYNRQNAEKGWHFLTGKEENIRRLAAQVGFKYKRDEPNKQWVHSAAAYVVTPAGVISIYHHGIDFDPKILRLSLIEASEEKIGTFIDQAVLFCLRYNPDKKTYAFYAFNFVRLVSGIVALGLIMFLLNFWIRQRNTKV